MPKKKKDGVITVTQAELEALIAKAVEASKPKVGGIPVDTTVDLPTGAIPRELIADKASLPPPEARTSSPAQPPARLWGQHLMPSPIQHLAVNGGLAGLTDPRTGAPFNQANMPTNGSSISPPPSRNFK